MMEQKQKLQSGNKSFGKAADELERLLHIEVPDMSNKRALGSLPTKI